MLGARFPETVTTGAFGPSAPSRSLDVKVIVCPPPVKVAVKVVITSSSFTGLLSSLLQEEQSTMAAKPIDKNLNTFIRIMV
ncbi:hypothetical protein D9M72_567530 [compost metagenome]